MLYTAIVNLVSAHLKLLQGSFKTIRDRSLSKLELNKHETDDVLKDSKELLNNIHMEIGFCINHLQNILKLVHAFWRALSFYFDSILFKDLREIGKYICIFNITTSTYIIGGFLYLFIFSFFGNFLKFYLQICRVSVYFFLDIVWNQICF